MADLKLDPLTGDLDISSGGLELVTGIDAIAQQIRIRLKFVLGEWFLDARQGIPWFQQVLVKNPNIARVREIINQTILTTPGVISLQDLVVSLDAATRAMTISFAAITTTGPLTFDGEDFIIT